MKKTKKKFFLFAFFEKKKLFLEIFPEFLFRKFRISVWLQEKSSCFFSAPYPRILNGHLIGALQENLLQLGLAGFVEGVAVDGGDATRVDFHLQKTLLQQQPARRFRQEEAVDEDENEWRSAVDGQKVPLLHKIGNQREDHGSDRVDNAQPHSHGQTERKTSTFSTAAKIPIVKNDWHVTKLDLDSKKWWKKNKKNHFIINCFFILNVFSFCMFFILNCFFIL